MSSKRVLGSLIVIFLFNLSGFPQQPQIKSTGLPFITNHIPEEYNWSNQNQGVLAASDGRIYFAGNNGLMVFDGHNYRPMTTPNNVVMRTIIESDDSTIYVAGDNEIGILEYSHVGELQFSSIRNLFEDKIKNNSFKCWRTIKTDSWLYFICSDQVLALNRKKKEIFAVEISHSSHISGSINGKLMAKIDGKLCELVDQNWRPLDRQPPIGILSSAYLFVVKSAENHFIITHEGIFNFNTFEPVQIPEGFKDFLSNWSAPRIHILPLGYIGISSVKGLLIADSTFNPLQLINSATGLKGNRVYDVAVDKNHLMWLGTDRGFSMVEIYSPYTIIDERLDITSSISFISEHNDQYYFSSNTGLYRISKQELSDPFRSEAFKRIDPKASWRTISMGPSLFDFSSAHLLSLSNNGSSDILVNNKVNWAGFKYKDSQDLLVATSNSEIIYLEIDLQGKIILKDQQETRLPGIHYMVQGKGNTVWISERNYGIHKIEYDRNKQVLESIVSYDKAKGLPESTWNYVFPYQGKPVFATRDGIYRYDEATDRFVPDERFRDLTKGLPITKLEEGENGDLYYYCNVSKNIINVLKKNESGYTHHAVGSGKLNNVQERHMEYIDSTSFFMGTTYGAVHLNPKNAQPVKTPFHTLITGINVISSDSLIYGGFGPQHHFSLPYEQNDLRIQFASTFYEGYEHIQYTWKLVGFDSDWATWSKEHQKDYTNILHGKYTFKVKSWNVYQEMSEEASFHFTILPPWYHTYWAYTLYGFAFIGFVWLLVKLNTRRLERDKLRLEGIVEERTEEIRKQKEQAEKDAITISDQHQQLLHADELKSRFFVNISHELRTPLTLTMGTVDQTLKGKFGQLNHEQYANLKVSYRNSERLLKMVNNILDISKLEGGKVQLYAQELDLSDLVNKVVAFFQSKMDDKKITLTKDLQSKSSLYIDKDKIETVLINLIANAFKFTPEGGSIIIKTKDLENVVELIVSDSGVGIPESDLPFVFDRFYQSEHLKSGEGTGVGLALSKELIDLHQGAIKVGSKLQEGTTFTITLKTGKDHLQPNQIIESEPFYKPITEKMPELSTPQTSQEISASQPEGRQHVLVVEDNYEMSRFIQQILDDQYQLTFAQDGQQAIGLLEEGQSFDLILTDYMMPIMNGYEMAMEIKKKNEWALIPMVFLTARAQEQDKIDLLNIGVDDYLYKPFNEHELKARINNLLKAKTQHAEYWIEKTIDPRDIEWKEFPSKLKLDIDTYIQEHITEDISGKDLAEITGQSERSLYRKVKANTGLTLNQYIKEYKLRKARALLENKQVMTVSEAANAVGFNYLHNFTNNFKERFGKLPSEYLD